ncbi:hypothetical protein HMPREF3232_00575 [Fannyhessea vaginae]|nr:hypothetical protein HMPREF3232_00575 [Fannyhessea vaginae]
MTYNCLSHKVCMRVRLESVVFTDLLLHSFIRGEYTTPHSALYAMRR